MRKNANGARDASLPRRARRLRIRFPVQLSRHESPLSDAFVPATVVGDDVSRRTVRRAAERAGLAETKTEGRLAGGDGGARRRARAFLAPRRRARRGRLAFVWNRKRYRKRNRKRNRTRFFERRDRSNRSNRSNRSSVGGVGVVRYANARTVRVGARCRGVRRGRERRRARRGGDSDGRRRRGVRGRRGLFKRRRGDVRFRNAFQNVSRKRREGSRVASRVGVRRAPRRAGARGGRGRHRERQRRDRRLARSESAPRRRGPRPRRTVRVARGGGFGEERRRSERGASLGRDRLSRRDAREHTAARGRGAILWGERVGRARGDVPAARPDRARRQVRDDVARVL